MTTTTDDPELLQYLQLSPGDKDAQDLDRRILARIPSEALGRFGATHQDLQATHQTPWKSPATRVTFATHGDRFGPPTAWSIGIRDARPSLEDLELVDGVWRQRRLSRRIQPDELAATLRAAGFTAFRYRTGNSGLIREETTEETSTETSVVSSAETWFQPTPSFPASPVCRRSPGRLRPFRLRRLRRGCGLREDLSL